DAEERSRVDRGRFAELPYPVAFRDDGLSVFDDRERGARHVERPENARDVRVEVVRGVRLGPELAPDAADADGNPDHDANDRCAVARAALHRRTPRATTNSPGTS